MGTVAATAEVERCNGALDGLQPTPPTPWPPRAEAVYDYGHQVRRKLRAAGLHVDIDVADRKMQKKVCGVGSLHGCCAPNPGLLARVPACGFHSQTPQPHPPAASRPLYSQVREAQLAQYNYILVLGEEEKKNGTVNVRTRDNQVGAAGHSSGQPCTLAAQSVEV